METVFIYGLFDPRNGELRYIGKAVNPKQRLLYHIIESRKKISLTHKEAWIKQLIINNLRPALVILEEVNEYEWEVAEQWWIKLARDAGFPLTNMTDGGDGFGSGEYHYGYGGNFSNEHKKNMSLAKMGKNNPMYGKAGANKGKEFSPSHKENLRLSHLGKSQTEETKRKRSLAWMGNKNPQFGKVRPEIHRKKLSESHKGIKRTEEQRKATSLSLCMNSAYKKGDIDKVHELQDRYFELFGIYNSRYLLCGTK